MKHKIILTLVLLLAGAPALAFEDSTQRYWDYGPAWYDTPCGLACFRMWERSGLEAGELDVRELKRIRTPGEMQRFLDASRAGSARGVDDAEHS